MVVITVELRVGFSAAGRVEVGWCEGMLFL